MHAFLVTGRGEPVEQKVEELRKNLKAKLLQFNLQKISDVRELSAFTNLKQNTKTAILLKNIDKASIAALNAFLKNLEEPQENIAYIMTCESKLGVLPTIVSRVKVIKTQKEEQTKEAEKIASKFLKMSAAEQLLYIKGLKDRSSAIEFVENLIQKTHKLMLEKDNVQKISKIAKKAEVTRQSLLANGNPTLQLTNFILEVE